MTTTRQGDGATLRRLGAAAVLMVFAVFLSRVIGFLREMFIAARFGADWRTDAYNAAFTIPDWLNYLVAGGTLSITFLPIYARALAANDEREANRVLSIVLTVVLAIVAVLLAIGEVFARPLMSWYFEKLDPRALDAAVHYTRILLPAQLCFIAGGIMNATLFARGRFGAAALAPLVYNLGIIAGGVALGPRYGVEGLAWGALAGAIAGPFLIPAADAVRRGARVRFAFAARDPIFLEWFKLTLPLMVGVSLVTADDWILRWFAAESTGDITRLNYAKRLVAVGIAVAGQAVGQASMPFFARLFAEDRRVELAETLVRTARSVMVFSIIVAAWFAALSPQLVEILFRRGAFTAADVTPTAMYLAIFAVALPFWTVQAIVSRAFYAARNTLTPMIAGTVVTALSLPIYALAFHWRGVTGLAVASGIGIVLQAVALFLLAPRILPELRAAARGHGARLLAGLLLATLAGAAAWGITRALEASAILEATAGSAAFGLIVLAGARPLGVEEISSVVGKVTRKLHRR